MRKFTLFIIVSLLLISTNSFALIELKSDMTYHEKLSSFTQLLICNSNKVTKAQKNLKHIPALIQSNEKQYISCFVELKDSDDGTFFENENVIVQSQVGNLFTCLISIDDILEVAQLDNVIRIEVAHKAKKNLDVVRNCSQITPIHTGENSFSKSFKGSGVIVGVVDEGFDFTHPNYYDASGETYRVKSIWNQNVTGTSPSGYTYGTEYTTKAEMLAAETDNSSETHGTHTSGIAAGSGYNTVYSGIAPESDIILVGTTMTTTGIIDGVKYIIDKAKLASQPCVVNLSLGSEIGPHDGTGMGDRMIDGMVGEGAIVVGAAGNSGTDAIHIRKQFASTGSDSLATFIVSDNLTSGCYIDIWGREGVKYYVTISIYDKTTKKYSETIAPISVAFESVSGEIPTSENTYYVSLANSLYTYNDNYNCTVELYSESEVTDEMVVIKVTMDEGTTGIVDMWATDATLGNNDLSGYLSGDTDYTVGEIGGVGKEIISVGAYCTKNTWLPLNNNNNNNYWEKYSNNPTLYSIADFSSKGPTADGRVKPDITAPGFGVVSGFNSYNSNYGASCVQTVSTATFNNRSYYWGIEQGTSMACPVIAGSIALWLQLNPKLTPSQAKSIFELNSFDPSVTRSLKTQSNTWGWGKLDALSGLQESYALSTIKFSGEDIAKLISIVTYNNKSFKVSSEAVIERVIVSDLSGRNIKEIITEEISEIDFDLKDMNSGVYLVKLFTKEGNATSKILVK